MTELFEHLGAVREDLPGTHCPVLLVGEDNPLSSDPGYALFPEPVHCSGWRFAELIANVGYGHQLATWRTNLCAGRWSLAEARARAVELWNTDGIPWRVIIMLGRKVSGAFAHGIKQFNGEFVFEPFSEHRIVHRIRPCPTPTTADIDWMTWVSLPHPSGRNVVWNNPAEVHRARQVLASAAPGWY